MRCRLPNDLRADQAPGCLNVFADILSGGRRTFGEGNGDPELAPDCHAHIRFRGFEAGDLCLAFFQRAGRERLYDDVSGRTASLCLNHSGAYRNLAMLRSVVEITQDCEPFPRPAVVGLQVLKNPGSEKVVLRVWS